VTTTPAHDAGSDGPTLPEGPATLPEGQAGLPDGPALWAKTGRPLPEPELLRPTLDPALPAYVPSGRMRGHLRGTATDVLPFLVERWAGAFRRHHPDVTIDVPPPYGGSPGAKRLTGGDADFSLQSRELKPSDLEAFTRTFGYGPLLVPISGGSWRHYGFLDALTVVVHRDNPLARITYAEIDAIFSRTRFRGHVPIRTWAELGLAGTRGAAPVNAWAPKPWNGYEEFVRQRVLSVGDRRGEWRDDIGFADLVIPIAGHVAADPNAIGYTGMAFLNDGVRSIAIAERDEGPFVPPSQEDVAAGRYPLSRVFYIVANRAPGSALDPLLLEFMRFILSREGQREIVDHGVFNPLRADQLRASRTLIDAT